MRYLFVFLLSISSLNLYAGSWAKQSNTVDYQIGQDEFVILFVNKSGHSQEKVENLVMKRAARVAKENGYSYFKVLEEREVYVVKSSGKSSAPSNEYQEMIVEKDFGKSSTEAKSVEMQDGVHRAYRVEIRGYHQKPAENYHSVSDY